MEISVQVGAEGVQVCVSREGSNPHLVAEIGFERIGGRQVG
jgi:hypothetical protein